MQRSSRVASRLSKGPSLKLKQEEVVFAMKMPSYCTNKRQKQMTLSSSEMDDKMNGTVIRRLGLHM